jgi:hypothetical protein
VIHDNGRSRAGWRLNEAREPPPPPQHLDGDRAGCRQGAGVLHRQPGLAPAGRCCGNPLDGRARPVVAAKDRSTSTGPRLRTRGTRNARPHGPSARHRHRPEASPATAKPAPFLLVAGFPGCPDSQGLMAWCIPTPLGLSERSFSVSIPETSGACIAPSSPERVQSGFRSVGFRPHGASMTGSFSPRKRAIREG